MWWVYILQSQASNRFYMGCTADLERRIHEHQTGQTPSTRNRGPWGLVYQKQFPNKASALAHEREIKAWKSAEMIRRLIESQW
jgi:putative endonuclease